MAKPGKIIEYLKSKDRLVALLHDFEVNSSDLKVEHRNWLKAVAKPYLSMSGASTLVIGLASTTGKSSWNRLLAQGRANNARKVMTELSPICRVRDAEIAAGEAAARLLGVADGVEDGRWRAVYIAIGAKVKTLPPPPPPKPKPIMVDRRRYVKYYISFKSKSDEMFGDKNDRRAAKIADSVSEATRACMEVSPSEELRITVDQTWTVGKIFVNDSKKTTGNGMFETTYRTLEVEFVWTPIAGERWFEMRGNPPRLLTDKEMNAWLDKPWSTYQSLNSTNTVAKLLCD